VILENLQEGPIINVNAKFNEKQLVTILHLALDNVILCVNIVIHIGNLVLNTPLQAQDVQTQHGVECLYVA
jgi:hypothetical protein